jgi:hypothetical protein
VIYNANIVVTAEVNHPIIWEFTDNGQPFSVVGRTYSMVIRQEEDGTVTSGVDVTFTCVVSTNRCQCTGDCSTLTPGVKYFFQLVENGIAIITGTATVAPRL